MKIYADNAATTKMSADAVMAMQPFFTEIYANPSSLHTLGQEAAEKLKSARESIADCIGAHADEIYFTSGGSEADNQAIRSAAYAGKKAGKTHIISTAFEHHAVLHTLDALARDGFEITLLGVGEMGLVTAQEVREAIRPDTCLVSVMYANNEIGTIQPIAEIGAVCRKAGVTFHTDAVQAVGHIPVSVAVQNIDMLSFSAHKFHGPKGVGVLYVKKGISLYSLIEGGAQERKKRAGTENLAGIAGCAAALTEAVAGLSQNEIKVRAMRDRLIEGLSEIPHSILNGDRFCRLPGNVNFCFEGIEGESLILLLDRKGICASSGSACTSGSLDPSHVLLSIGRPHEIAHGSLRLTICEQNTQNEVEEIISAVSETVSYLRSFSPVWRDLISQKKKFIIK